MSQSGRLGDDLEGLREISLRDLDDATITEGSKSDDAGNLPWKLVVHFTEYPVDSLIQLDKDGKVVEDVFINSVKEASFVRHGSGKVVMKLGENDSKQLWKSVEYNDLLMFSRINSKLLDAPGTAIRHIPFRVFLPTTPSTKTAISSSSLGTLNPPNSPGPKHEPSHTASLLRMIQRLIPPTLSPSSRQPQTLGSTLHSMLPTLFPSRRQPVLAWPVIHGAVIPMGASLEELGRWASYADGWVTVSVIIME